MTGSTADTPDPTVPASGTVAGQLPPNTPASTGLPPTDDPSNGNDRGVRLGPLGITLLAVVFVVSLGAAYSLGRLLEVPGSFELWRVAAQPLAVVTAGVLAVGAAGVTFAAHSKTSSAASASAKKQRDKEIRDEALERCWTRFLWVIDQSNPTQPPQSRSAFPPEVEPVLVLALLEDAAKLDDPALLLFIAEYSSEASTSWRKGGSSAAPPSSSGVE
ncbi:hypothetical protein SRABI91_04508 [Rhodococcoides fascians]|nr:hypothetical protein SRABI91_04508 [Rhodococcus fascians]